RRLGQGCRSEYGIFAIGRAASFPWHVAVSLQKRTAVSERFRTPGVSPPIQHASREPAAAQSCRVIDESRYGRLRSARIAGERPRYMAQNAYLRPNWICLAAVADVTLPKDDDVSVAFGLLKFT